MLLYISQPRLLLLGLLVTKSVAVNRVNARRATTTTSTVYEIVTESFIETLYERQQGVCGFGGLDFCSNVESQWLHSNEFGSMGSTSGGNPSATSTSTSPSASASSEYQQILSGSTFQLFVTQDNGTIAYISINSDGFAYLIGSRTGQLFQWSNTSLRTYETTPRDFLALPDSEASRREMRLEKRQTLTNATNRGTIRADEIIPAGASTNFTLLLHEVDTELILTFEQREALFGTGPGCTSNSAAPDEVLAFGIADDYSSLSDCSVVSISARVASGVSSISTNSNTGTNSGPGSSGSSGGSSRSGSSGNSSGGSNGGSNGSGGLSSGNSDTGSDNDSITSLSSSGSNLPSSTDSGPITSDSATSSTSASPGSGGTSSPSNTNSPESCTDTTCSSSSSNGGNSASTTGGCEAKTAIPASLSCPNHVDGDYITLDMAVYSLCTGYSILSTTGVVTDADAINVGTIRLLPCLETCVSRGYSGALFSAHCGWDYTKNTWMCGCGTTTNSYLTPTGTYIGLFTSKTAAVFICSNTFDYSGTTPDPTRDTIIPPPKSECYLPVTDKVSASKRCPYNTDNTWQNIIYSDGQIVTSLCPGAMFVATLDLMAWTTFSTSPVPLSMSYCLQACANSVGYSNTCPGVALVADSTSLSNGYRAKCVMATGGNLALLTTDSPALDNLRWLTAGEHICNNGFMVPQCWQLLSTTPATASCCSGVKTSYRYTLGISVFNVCEGCMWDVRSTAGSTKIGTENNLFYDQCMTSYCQGGESCSAIAAFTTTATTGATPTYQCVSMGQDDATMTNTVADVGDDAYWGTAVAFLCTNTFGLQLSAPITSDLAPVFQFCAATVSTGASSWTSFFATTQALYNWNAIATATSVLLSAGCTYGCSDRGPATQAVWAQKCATAVAGGTANYFEVVREKGNDGKCYCRYPQQGAAAAPYIFASFTANTDVIEVYAYTGNNA
ncbi:hypothetical protein TWF481_000080 [Arthrobotrys musiformis]|uniref:Uncharacterized protein n=1 Tax=Arthrobotrys musiformis TaxID=47236 RepID=A0AAV9WLJ5_9PEZI